MTSLILLTSSRHYAVQITEVFSDYTDKYINQTTIVQININLFGLFMAKIQLTLMKKMKTFQD